MERIPSVIDGVLRGAGFDDSGPTVGSPAWFVWLAGESARSFAFQATQGRFTARKERRQRGGDYWVAYRTVGGRQHKAYLGRHDDLTPQRLAGVAAALAGRAAETGQEVPAEPHRGLSPTFAPVLAAKLMVPPVRRATVTRPRLHERLSRRGEARLTTVVAPAGWGKTTLLAGWAREVQERRPVCWLSIDESDDEPVRFWTYALSALSQVAPATAGNALRGLSAPAAGPVTVALAALLDGLTTETDEYVLILDDYHLIADGAIHESVEFLIAYLPPALHLIISSRVDPPLPLARMRASGALAEIRAADLRCTATEGAALLAGVTGVPQPAADALVARAEGWAAGLQLAALALRDAPDPAATVAAIRRDGRHILDYFDTEVIKRLSAHQRDLLVRCSVLERLSGSLCDAVLGTSGSTVVLDELDRAELFVTAIGDGWYRCHGLFREALRRELELTTPSGRAPTLARAAGWYLAHGHVEEAVTHLLEAGDDVSAFAVIRRTGWFLDHTAMSTLLRHGQRLAASVPDPRLYLTLALAAGHTGQLERSVPWLEAAEVLIDADADAAPLPGWRSLRAAADVLWASFGRPSDVHAALRHARRAVEREDDPACTGYVIARMSLAGALIGVGHVAEAVSVLRECWQAPVRRTLPPVLHLQCAGQLALALVDHGDLDAARRVAAEVAGTAAEAEQTWGAGAGAAVALLRLAEGRLLAATDPAASVPALHRAVALAESWGRPTLVVRALTGLAAAHWAAGDGPRARTTIARAREVAEEVGQHLAAGELDDLESRIGRGAVRTARRHGALREALTDRELTVLRALRSPLSAREIGAELYLSINTVKGYKKSLYRKLGVVTRVDAVRRGHELDLL